MYIDTTGFMVDKGDGEIVKRKRFKKKKSEIDLKAVTFATRWTNPPEYTGAGLLIPWRFGDGMFSESDRTYIRDCMDRMTKKMSGKLRKTRPENFNQIYFSELFQVLTLVRW